MIIRRADIEKLIESKGIIEDYDPSLSANNPAKVELRLGNKCYLSSRSREIIELVDGDKVVIKPYDILLYQTLEKVNIPNNVAGHISLKMKYTARGLLMSNQTQVDPGYNNYLFGMLYNLSDHNIELECGTPIVTLELFQVKGNAIDTYNGYMATISFEEFCRQRVGSSLAKLASGLESQAQDIERLRLLVETTVKNNGRHLNVITGIVGIISLAIAVISVIAAIVVCKPDATIARLSEKVDYQKQTISVLQGRLEKLESPNVLPVSFGTGNGRTDKDHLLSNGSREKASRPPSD